MTKSCDVIIYVVLTSSYWVKMSGCLIFFLLVHYYLLTTRLDKNSKTWNELKDLLFAKQRNEEKILTFVCRCFVGEWNGPNFRRLAIGSMRHFGFLYIALHSVTSLLRYADVWRFDILCDAKRRRRRRRRFFADELGMTVYFRLVEIENRHYNSVYS